MSPCYVELFVAEHEGEVRYNYHARTTHQGYGGRRFQYQMVDGYDPKDWKGCSCGCNYTNGVTTTSNPRAVFDLTGKRVVNCAINRVDANLTEEYMRETLARLAPEVELYMTTAGFITVKLKGKAPKNV